MVARCRPCGSGRWSGSPEMGTQGQEEKCELMGSCSDVWLFALEMTEESPCVRLFVDVLSAHGS